MPHFFNNILVVTKEELVPIMTPTYEALKVKYWRDNKRGYGLKVIQNGGKGRKLRISFDSLPAHIQDAIGDPRKLNHILEQFYRTDSKAIDFYSEFQYPDGSYLLPETEEQYITNASMVIALLKLKTARINERASKGNLSSRGINTTLIADAISFNAILNMKYGVKHNLPTSRRFTPMLKAFIESEYISLIKDANGKRKTNAIKKTDETDALLNAMFVSQKFKPNSTQIADQYDAFISGYLDIVNEDTGEIYNPKDFKELSTNTITNFLASWDSTMGTHPIRNGNRQQLTQRFKPYHSLHQPKFANSIISIDDRQPPFEYEKGKRMWFYNAIDLASGAFVCWVYGKTKEGIILDFYRQLVRNYHDWNLNLPAELECESSLNSSFKNTFLKEGVMFEHVRIEANKARSKRIEAYFKPLRYNLEKESMGWIPRPFAKSEPNQLSNIKKKIIPYTTLTKERINDLETWNNMEHAKTKGISRIDYFFKNQNPNVKPTNYKHLLPLLGYHTETSCNAGLIKLQSKEWLLGDKGEIYTGENLISLMQKVESNDIDIYWMDDNEGSVFKALVFINGRYICEALPKPRYARAKIELTDAGRQAREIMSSYATTIDAYMKNQKNAIEKVMVTDNRSKRLNNNFKITGLSSTYSEVEPTIKQEPIIELEPIQEEAEYEYTQKENEGDDWKSAFRI